MFDQNGPIQIRPAGMSRNALGIMMEAEQMAVEIDNLIAQDPIGAAKSEMGRFHLRKFGWMRPNAYTDAFTQDELAPELLAYKSEFPYLFELVDVMLHSKEIISQLLAIEYIDACDDDLRPDHPLDANREDLSPYTPDALFQLWDRENQLRDPFTTDYRSDTTVQVTHADGHQESYREDGGVPALPPTEGFTEYKPTEENK